MAEDDRISSTPEPRTRQSLAADLQKLGLEAGMIVLVHSSLASLGWVNGQAVAVIQALQDVLSPGGTLVMPAHSGDLSDPAKWENPPVPQAWWAIIRDTMPAYDPRTTPTRGIGLIPEQFRTWPDVLRSGHPALSFSAWGAQAEAITRNHRLEDSLGEGSPLARLYELDGCVLLLGAGYDSNTSFHLAEYRLPWRKDDVLGAPILREGKRVWVSYQDVDLDETRFAEIGEAFERAHPVRVGQVGSATSRLFRQRPAVDFAAAWMAEHLSA
jgi:aminoglycoside 3-N-acetyltransferase